MSYSPPYSPPISPLGSVSKATKVVSITASGNALIEATEGLLPLLSLYVKKVKQNQNRIRKLLKRLQELQRILRTLDQLTQGACSELDEELQKCKSQIDEMFNRLERDQPSSSWKLVQKISRISWPYDYDESEQLYDTISNHVSEISYLFEIEIGIIRGVASIPCVAGAAAISERDDELPHCLQGTRTQLLADISQWKIDPGSPTIYWLHGEIGTGKSTIARTFNAATANNKNEILVSFCFSRVIRDFTRSKWVFTTIATQLANASRQDHPIVGREIGRAMSKDPKLPHKPIEDQWRYLILEPLVALDKGLEEQLGITLTFDGLDECRDEEDIQLILELLLRVKCFDKIQFRCFTTSRPAHHLVSTLNKMTQEDLRSFSLHGVEQEVVDNDITRFIEHEFSLGRSDNSTLPWPENKNKIKLLASQASGSFLYASTACRFIRCNIHSTPSKTLDLVLRSGVDVEPAKRLNKLYAVVLINPVSWDNAAAVIEQRAADFRQYIGPLITMVDTLPLQSYLKLLSPSDGDEDRIMNMLNHLRSVLEVSDHPKSPIRLLHSSFRDFVGDNSHVPPECWINQTETHLWLANRCLELMETGLRYNVCSLEPDSPPTITSHEDFIKAVSPELQYACRYCVDHLFNSKHAIVGGNAEAALLDRVTKFLSEHFLQWLEVSSLIGKFFEVEEILTDLRSFISDKSDHPHQSVLDDAIIYSSKFGKIIEKAPLQAYYCASTYQPTAGFTGPNLANYLQLPKRVSPDLGTDYSLTPDVHDRPYRSVHDRDSRRVHLLAISSDGRLLTSAALDGSLKLWETNPSKLRHILTIDPDGFDSIVFSPNSTFLASAIGNCSIKLWDTTSGALRHTLKGHYDTVYALSWSPDSSLLASASFDRKVRTWDADSGKAVHVLEGHYGAVTTIAFSLDGKLIASASCNGTLKLWNATTGKEERKINGYPMGPGSMGFLPGGKYFVVECVADNIEVYDVRSGKRVELFDDHLLFKNALAFLPEGPWMMLNKTLLSAVDYISGKSLDGTAPGLPPIVFIEDEWVCIGAKGVLWLPKEYQNAVVASHGRTVAFGLESGAVVIIKFGDETI